MRQDAPLSAHAHVASPTPTSPPKHRSATPARGVGPALRRAESVSSATDTRRPWTTIYVHRIMLGDAVSAVAAAFTGYTIRFGPLGRFSQRPDVALTFLLPVLWVFAMFAARSYEKRVLWLGPEEFRRIFSASTLILAIVGTVSWAFRLEVARGFVVVALPLATALTLVQRYAQRKWIHHLHRGGQLLKPVLLVGHRGGVAELHNQISREPYHGYRVIGCCLPAPLSTEDSSFEALPVLGGLEDVVDVVRQFRVDTVAVLPTPYLDGAALRRLGWQLEETRAELLLAPAITEIAGPRVRIRPVCGLPLLHVERPELRGLRRLVKGVVDRVGATVLLLLLLPVLLTSIVAIKLDSRGPVLFRQHRIGRNGSTFPMLKLRTMYVGAENALPTLTAESDGNGILFKLRSDPRVTRVGRTLRRFSVDELPQLLNVLRGEMSLVGPRPPLASEVERYGLDMHRRFLVKPGLTGLWQVSGRSDLSWEDSVRIDVRYVENWSLAFDLMILWKTVGAVFRGSGAY
jgi:exopolysaccharide biosynthesis polyprenyl glycosylphosphotransferase